jgi:hypothetical protein
MNSQPGHYMEMSDHFQATTALPQAKISSTHWNGLHGLQRRSEGFEVNNALLLPEMKSEFPGL